MTMKSLLLFLFALFAPCIVHSQLDESERQMEYLKRGYQWPMPEYQPNTAGWKRLMDRRFHQVEHIQDEDERYQGWLVTVITAYVQQNFTETGWGLTRGPQWLTELLQKEIREGIPTARVERSVDVVLGEPPLFIYNPKLNQRVLDEMHPILEAWSKIDLKPIVAYGFRLYRNQSSLLMHLDETRTHVISCIYHIASSENSKPWPLLIEDFEGNTNEVILTPGDILLYESSKCVHGRPSKFNGDWYSSIFVHFAPAIIEWALTDQSLEGHYAVPPHWDSEATTESLYPPLVMQGAALTEPSCENDWCALNDTIKWFGPGEEGYVLTTGNRRYSLYEESGTDETSEDGREEL